MYGKRIVTFSYLCAMTRKTYAQVIRVHKNNSFFHTNEKMLKNYKFIHIT